MNDKQNTIDVDAKMALETVDGWVDGFVKIAPNLVVALVVFLLFFLASVVIKSLVLRSARKRGRENLGVVLGGFVKSSILLIGILISATIVVPSLNPGDLIAGLGVSSVAIGFAFKDILQNWLAGLLILIRQPFQVGDQIVASGHEGTVERIETRATLIKTYDGQRAVIPNSEIYTNAVLVKTAFEKRRSQYDIGIGYGDDCQKACEIIKEAIAKVSEVEKDPSPEAFAWDLAASWVTVRARWWTASTRADVVHTQARVILAIKEALDAAAIDMPYETQVHLFHDQTEERDGIPGQQREGWPAPADVAVTSRWRKEKELNDK